MKCESVGHQVINNYKARKNNTNIPQDREAKFNFN